MILRENGERQIYSDGYETENRMLEIAANYPEEQSQDYIKDCNEYIVNNTFSEVRHNILNWYPFKSDATLLEIGAGMGAITGMLCDRVSNVTALEMSKERARVIESRYPTRKNLEILTEDIFSWETDRKYDYVVFIGVLEYAGIFSGDKKPYNLFIRKAKELLKENGVLLFAIENRFGLKYWLGGSEDHLQAPFKGIEGYKEPKTARTFSRRTLETMLEEEGFLYNRIYSVYPDYKFPEIICTKEIKPSYMALQKINFTYSKNSEVIVDERNLYKDIWENDVMEFFANSFLVEAKVNADDTSYVTYVSAKGESKREYKVSTVIMSDGTVRKVPMNRDALRHVETIYRNNELLKKREVNVIDALIQGEELISRFVEYEGAQDYFVQILKENSYDKIKQLVALLKESITNSSEISNKDSILVELELSDSDANVDCGVILRDGFIDMTLYNAFYDNGKLIFYDQEWRFENIPLNFILYYGLKTSYYRSFVNTEISFDQIMNIAGIKEAERPIYDRLEEYIWSKVLYRQTDFYGDGGYCNRYNEAISMNEVRTKEKEQVQAAKEKAIECEERNRIIGEKLRETENQVQEKQNTINELGEKLDNSERRIYELNSTIDKLNSCVEEYSTQLNNKQGHIELLLEQERKYMNLLNSKGVRLLMVWWKLKDMMFPQGSTRRAFMKKIKSILRGKREF